MSTDEELLDVIDEEGNVVDRQSRLAVHTVGLRHKEIHVWFFDGERNIYFQQSGPNKPSANLFDATIGGHVVSGEDPILSALRETEEETGVILRAEDIVLLTSFSDFSKYSTTTRVNNFVRYVYICKKPILENEIKIQGDLDSLGIKKFSFYFLNSYLEKNKHIFHKFLAEREIPFVLEFIKDRA